MELYFEKTIAVRIASLTNAVSFSVGWLRGMLNAQTFYLKVVDQPLNASDIAYIKAVRSYRGLVVLIAPVFNCGRLSRYEIHPGFKFNEQEQRIGSWVCRNTSSALSVQGGVSNDVADLSNLFASLSREELLRVFHSRLVMNSAKIYGPTDIDGIFLTKEKELVVCEFKRKYPAVGYRPFLQKMLDAGDVEDRVIAVRANSFNPCEMVSSAQLNKPCFGLDLSHVQTFFLAKKMGLKYFYFIVDSEDKNPANFFLTGFLTKTDTTVCFRELDPGDFSGLTNTDGLHNETGSEKRSQSGSFHKGRRYQFVVEKSLFEKSLTLKAAPLRRLIN